MILPGVSTTNFGTFVDEVNDNFASSKEGIESKINELQELNQDCKNLLYICWKICILTVFSIVSLTIIVSSRLEDVESDINNFKNGTVDISSKVLNEDSSLNDTSSLKIDLDNLKKLAAIGKYIYWVNNLVTNTKWYMFPAGPCRYP